MIFFLSLYVDSAPSHVLAFLREMEGFCWDNDVRLHIYCVANSGFIEGRQNQPLMQLFQNFCAKSRLDWRGGLGIGGGVMLNVTRILFLVNAAELLLSMALSGLAGGVFLPPDALRSFAVNTLLLLFLNASHPADEPRRQPRREPPLWRAVHQDHAAVVCIYLVRGRLLRRYLPGPPAGFFGGGSQGRSYDECVWGRIWCVLGHKLDI
ncbi:MAG: hypothetical protein LUH42_04240 [Oscillospiraceae bacterium]|nr:hypothetical protein [Oscillospiraceae bacterium]